MAIGYLDYVDDDDDDYDYDNDDDDDDDTMLPMLMMIMTLVKLTKRTVGKRGRGEGGLEFIFSLGCFPLFSIFLRCSPLFNSFHVVLHCSAGFDNSPTAELKAAGIKALRVKGLVFGFHIKCCFFFKLFLPGSFLFSGINCRVCYRTNHGPSQEHPHELRHDQEGQL